MTKPYQLRMLAGFVAAWAASVSVAFLAGCVFALFMGNDAIELFKAAASGNKDALNIILFVGGTSAMAAGVVAFLATVFIAWPLYFFSRKLHHVTLCLYVLVGVGIALVVSVILLALQHLIRDFPGGGVWFQFAAIIVAGPIATLTFWAIVRPGGTDRNQPA